MGRPPTSRSIVSLKGLNGLRSNAAASSKPAPTTASASILEKPEAQTQRSRPATAKSIQAAPREAQLGAETTRDFADFIRSTGPKEGPGSDITIKAASPATDTLRSSRPTTSDHPSVSGTSTGRKITKPNPGLSKSPPPVAQIAPPKRTSSKLQAREATYQPTHNEDLLDFLKQGPADSRINEKRPVPGPVASVVPQNPRIPNSTPQRQIDNTRSSVASTHDSSFAERSIHSINSRTGLLDSPKGTFGGSPQSSQRQMPSFDGAPSQPPRKQRRVKDPYAIDTDSEDDDRPGTPKPQKQEESLIDFLNSTAPPSEAPKVPSAFDDIPDLSIRSPKNIQVNGNKSRDTYSPRNTARTAPTPGIRSAVTQPSNSSPQSQQVPPRGRSLQDQQQQQPPQLPPLNSHDISPTFTNTTYNLNNNNKKPSPAQQPSPSTALHSNNPYPPISTSSSSNTNNNNPSILPPAAHRSNHNPINRPHPTKSAGVARSERDKPRGTADLADFLRNSEPPTEVPVEFLPSRERERGEDGGGGGGGGGKGVWGRLKGRGRKGR
ncbi:MAG: hypothetical protein LQ350_003730 [Teloschistes chrysophthalmus]|nr:MAG: hypothetical protein LQ350_003730 [Niorma chrysophthalma]